MNNDNNWTCWSLTALKRRNSSLCFFLCLHSVTSDPGCHFSTKVTTRRDKMSSGVLIVTAALTVVANKPQTPHRECIEMCWVWYDK